MAHAALRDVPIILHSSSVKDFINLIMTQNIEKITTDTNSKSKHHANRNILTLKI